MSQIPTNQGMQYGTIFGGDGYTPPFNQSGLSDFLSPAVDRLAQGLMTSLGGIIGGSGMLPGNPFSSGNDIAFNESQRRLMATLENTRLASVELMRIDSQRINSLAQGMSNMILGPSSLETKQDIARNSDAAASFVTSQLGRTVLSAAGINPEALVPTINLPREAYNLLRTADPGLAINPHMLSQFAAELGKGAGIMGDGSIDPTRSFGFTAGEQASMARSLQSRGFIGLGIDDTLSTISSSERAALASGDPVASRNFAQLLAGRTEQAIQTFLPSFAEARQVFGEAKPEELFRSIQAVTGGGIGQMAPQQIQSQLEGLKQLSESAGIAVKTLTEFIEQSVSLAQQNGLNGSVAARNSLGALQQAFTSSQRFTELAGLNTPGIDRDPMSLINDIQQRQMSAQSSPLANRSAVAIRELEQFAAINGLDGMGQINAPDAQSRQLVSDLSALRGGTLDAAGMSRLSSDTAVASSLSRITGANAVNIVERLQDPGLGQTALASFPELVPGIANLQVTERANRRLSDVSNLIGRDVNADEAGALLSAALVSGNNVGAFANTVNTLAREDSSRFGGLTDIVSTRSSQQQASMNTINGLAGIASDLGITHGQAIGVLGQSRSQDAITRLTDQSNAISQLNEVIGGIPAFDRLVQSMSAGGFREGVSEALGGTPRSELIQRVMSSGYLQDVSRMSDGSAAAAIDALTMLAPPNEQNTFRGSLLDAVGAGSAGARERALHGVLSESIGEPVPAASAGDDGSVEAAIMSGFGQAGTKVSSSITNAIIEGLRGVSVFVQGSGDGGGGSVVNVAR